MENQIAELTETVSAPVEVGDILRANGEAFSTHAAMLAAITRVNCIDTHTAMQTESGGWIGVPNGDPRIAIAMKRTVKAPEIETKETISKKKTYPVRVMRISGDEANRDQVVKVTVNSPNERAVFKPGEKVELTYSQLCVLKDSIQDTRIEIEPNSGIYSSRVPEVAAQNMYPDMQIHRDPHTGHITAVKHIANYVINFLGERPPGWID